jgi:hypothetical protein
MGVIGDKGNISFNKKRGPYGLLAKMCSRTGATPRLGKCSTHILDLFFVTSFAF